MIDSYLHALNSNSLDQIETAIIALGESDNSKAVAPLVRALHRFKQQPEITALICDALGELGDLRATQALLSQLRDPDDEVRESAFTALFTIGERRAHAMPDASSLGQGFADPATALTQIAWQTDHEAVHLLIQALQGEDQQVKVGALYTLGQLGFVGAFEQIRSALYEPIEEVNAAAAFALGELARQGSQHIAVAVCEALYGAWYREQSGGLPLGLDAQIQVLRAAAECFTSSSLPTAQQQIATLFVSALEHPEHVLRQLAVIGLGRLGDQRALPALAQSLADPEPGVRRNAAYAIGTLKYPQGAQMIVNAAAGQPSEVRVAMAWSLKRIARDYSLSALDQGLSSSRPDQRAASAYLLGELGESQRLAKVLNDPEPEVRKNAVLAIGNAQAHVLIPLLIKALDDLEWRVRTAAAEALKRLKAVNALSALELRLSREKHSVARNALTISIKHLKHNTSSH